MEISKKHKYRFNPDWHNTFAHSDIGKVMEELDSINESFGEINAKNIVACAKNKNSVLHGYFEWNDGVAAEKYRIAQARNLLNNIQVVVLSDGKEKLIKAYETVRRAAPHVPGSVKKFNMMTPADIERVKRIVMGDLRSCATRLSGHDHFDKGIKKINEAIEILQRVDTKSTTETKKPETPLAAVV